MVVSSIVKPHDAEQVSPLPLAICVHTDVADVTELCSKTTDSRAVAAPPSHSLAPRNVPVAAVRTWAIPPTKNATRRRRPRGPAGRGSGAESDYVWCCVITDTWTFKLVYIMRLSWTSCLSLNAVSPCTLGQFSAMVFSCSEESRTTGTHQQVVTSPPESNQRTKALTASSAGAWHQAG